MGKARNPRHFEPDKIIVIDFAGDASEGAFTMRDFWVGALYAAVTLIGAWRRYLPGVPGRSVNDSFLKTASVLH